VDDALNERSPIIEQDTTLMAAPVERELFDHRILYIEEDMVNRMLRAAFRNHWLIYSVTFEFEPNNQVFLSIITKWGNVINVEFTIEDVWFDDYSSSFAIKLDTANIDTGGFILNSILHLLGNWCLSLFGIFFNPIAIGRLGSTVDPVDTFTVPDVPTRTSWVRSIDIAAVLLLPIGVWITFIILHHYLPTETLEFSFSTYFLISLGIFIISFLVMNIPRYVYMYVDSRKQWQSAFVHNNIKIQLRKLHRRIFMQQASLSTDCDECVASQSQERIKQLLLQIRDKRFLANRLKIADDDRARKQKVKFIIAYIGCTLIELMLLMN